MRAIFRKYDLPYQDVDILSNPDRYEEMIRKTGQQLSPCVEVDGVMLADVSGDEVEAYLVKKGYVQPSDQPADVPTNSSCQTDSAVHLK